MVGIKRHRKPPFSISKKYPPSHVAPEEAAPHLLRRQIGRLLGGLQCTVPATVAKIPGHQLGWSLPWGLIGIIDVQLARAVGGRTCLKAGLSNTSKEENAPQVIEKHAMYPMRQPTLGEVRLRGYTLAAKWSKNLSTV